MFVYVKKIVLFCSVEHSVTYKVTVFFLKNILSDFRRIHTKLSPCSSRLFHLFHKALGKFPSSVRTNVP